MSIYNDVKEITSEEEYKKNPKLKKSDVEALKKWAEKQPHFPRNIRDELLIRFLHCSNYSIERSKQYLDNFLTIRTHAPEIFPDKDINPEEIQQICQIGRGTVLPLRNEDGYIIVFKRLSKSDPSQFNYTDIIRLEMLFQDFFAMIIGTVPGIVFVTDVKHLTMAHAMRINPSVLKKHLTYVQEAAPLNVVASHVINVNPAFHWLLNLAKQFIKKDLINKTFLHSKMETLYEHLPKRLLPQEYGGELETLDHYFDEMVVQAERHFSAVVEKSRNLKVDESKRPGKAKSSSDVFGIEGSFKKLDID